MAGQSAPLHWVANHRRHHQHSDGPGDPHSPHCKDGKPLSRWHGFWHAHLGWLSHKGGYDAEVVRDLLKRPDLRWIDSTWHWWYLFGMALPAGIGYAVGGTAYDALAGFLWGGLYRHFLSMQATYSVNSVSHLWGHQEFATGDHSRNNPWVAIAALGEGWHNNHHAFPRSAKHGLTWKEFDFNWYQLQLLEKLGLIKNVYAYDLATESETPKEMRQAA